MSVGIGTVLLLAGLLLCATFAIGIIPLYCLNHGISNRASYIDILSRFGVGMLLGTSFMLVIPEGVRACLEHNGNVGLNLLIGVMVVYILDQSVQIMVNRRSATTNAIQNNITFEIDTFRDLLRNPKQVAMSILQNNVVFALVVHGLSDGIALGTTVNNESLLIIVLIAIVVHKIPAVLSLTSVMISKQHLPKWEIMSNLFAFALSTPLGYVVVSAFNLKQSDTMDWIGWNLLLMSGGSLLYASFTAFTTDESSNQSETDDTIENGFYREGSNFVLVNNNPREDSSNKSQNSNVEFENVAPLTPPPNMNNAQLKKRATYHELIYVSLGVLIPVIISFVITED